MSCGHEKAQQMRMFATASTSRQTQWYFIVVRMHQTESSVFLVVHGPCKLKTHDHQNHRELHRRYHASDRTGTRKEWNTTEIAAGFFNSLDCLKEDAMGRGDGGGVA